MATIGINVTDVQTVAQGPAFSLGTKGVLEGPDGTKEYLYVKNSAVAIVAEGYVCGTYGLLGEAGLLADSAAAITRGARVGTSPRDVPALNYFWLQIYGNSPVRTLASFAAGAEPFVTTTAGAIDDAATAGLEAISGLVVITATGGAAATNPSGRLSYPTIGRTV